MDGMNTDIIQVLVGDQTNVIALFGVTQVDLAPRELHI